MAKRRSGVNSRDRQQKSEKLYLNKVLLELEEKEQGREERRRRRRM